MQREPSIQSTVYTPDSSLANPFVMAKDMLGDLWAGRELAWRLTVRDISAQYRQTFLGILWALILPLANTVVWLFLSGAGIVVRPDVSRMSRADRAALAARAERGERVKLSL